MFVPLAFHKESIITRGLILHIDAADRTSHSPTSTKWNDLSGNNLEGSLLGASLPSFNSDNGGNIRFNDTSNRCDFETFSTSNFYALENAPFSINVWLRFPNVFPPGNKGIINTQKYFTEGGGTDTGGFGLSTTNSVGFRILLTESVGAASSTSTDLNIPFSDLSINKWYNVCFSYMYGNMNGYLNGVNTLSSTLNRPWSTSSLNRLRVGGPTQGGWNYLEIDIAVTMLYDRALTSNDVIKNYNALKSRFDIL